MPASSPAFAATPRPARLVRSNRPNIVALAVAPPEADDEDAGDRAAVGDLVEAAVNDLVGRLAGVWRSRSRRCGAHVKAAASLRLYLEREVRGLSFAELGRIADPPITREGAHLAYHRGQQLAELARQAPPASRSNPDVRVERPARRRGESPSW